MKLKSMYFVLFVALFFASQVQSQGYAIGDVAADFSLKNVDGEMVSLSDYEDAKGFVIAFTCNHCPFAVKYEDRLIDLHNRYAPMGYHVVAINPNDPIAQPADDFESMKVRAAEKEFPFAYLLDEGQSLYPQYGATRTPHIYLLDENRKVRYIGAIDDNYQDADAVEEAYLEDAIKAISKGEEPAKTMTKAIGCTIKTKRS